MRLALACDYLISPNRLDTTLIFEGLCQLFPRAPIYTYIHRKGRFSGQIEQHSIHSSYLSNLVRSDRSFKRWNFLIPGTAGKIRRSFQEDIVFSFSEGPFPPVIGTNPHSIQIFYIYSMQFLQSLKSSRGFFASYLNAWTAKNLQRPEFLVFSSHWLQREFSSYFSWSEGKIQTKIITPFIDATQFNLVENEEEKKSLLVVLTDGFETYFFELMKILKKNQVDFKILVPWKNLPESLKRWIDLEKIHWYAPSCVQEVTPLLRNVSGLIDLNERVFPFYGLYGLLSRVPILVRDHPLNREMLEAGLGIYFLPIEKTSPAESIVTSARVDQFLNELSWHEPKLLRRFALRFSRPKFAASCKSLVEQAKLLLP